MCSATQFAVGVVLLAGLLLLLDRQVLAQLSQPDGEGVIYQIDVDGDGNSTTGDHETVLWWIFNGGDLSELAAVLDPGATGVIDLSSFFSSVEAQIADPPGVPGARPGGGGGGSSSDPCHFLRGDANRDWNVDVADTAFLLNYLFVPNSPVPENLDAADANDDGSVDIADNVRIFDWLFGGGPPLAAPSVAGYDYTPLSLEDCHADVATALDLARGDVLDGYGLTSLDIGTIYVSDIDADGLGDLVFCDPQGASVHRFSFDPSGLPAFVPLPNLPGGPFKLGQALGLDISVPLYFAVVENDTDIAFYDAAALNPLTNPGGQPTYFVSAVIPIVQMISIPPGNVGPAMVIAVHSTSVTIFSYDSTLASFTSQFVTVPGTISDVYWAGTTLFVTTDQDSGEVQLNQPTPSFQSVPGCDHANLIDPLVTCCAPVDGNICCFNIATHEARFLEHPTEGWSTTGFDISFSSDTLLVRSKIHNPPCPPPPLEPIECDPVLVGYAQVPEYFYLRFDTFTCPGLTHSCKSTNITCHQAWDYTNPADCPFYSATQIQEPDGTISVVGGPLSISGCYESDTTTPTAYVDLIMFDDPGFTYDTLLMEVVVYAELNFKFSVDIIKRPLPNAYTRGFFTWEVRRQWVRARQGQLAAGPGPQLSPAEHCSFPHMHPSETFLSYETVEQVSDLVDIPDCQKYMFHCNQSLADSATEGPCW